MGYIQVMSWDTRQQMELDPVDKVPVLAEIVDALDGVTEYNDYSGLMNTMFGVAKRLRAAEGFTIYPLARVYYEPENNS